MIGFYKLNCCPRVAAKLEGNVYSIGIKDTILVLLIMDLFFAYHQRREEFPHILLYDCWSGLQQETGEILIQVIFTAQVRHKWLLKILEFVRKS